MTADPLEGRERARQEFEQWAKSPASHVCSLKRDLDGEYEDIDACFAWEGWQARGRSIEQERDELRDMLRQAYHFVPFGWAGRAKLENLLDKGDS